MKYLVFVLITGLITACGQVSKNQSESSDTIASIAQTTSSDTTGIEGVAGVPAFHRVGFLEACCSVLCREAEIGIAGQFRGSFDDDLAPPQG